MTNVVIVGAQWGDEGKGKIVDLLSDGSLVDIPDIAYPLNVKYDVVVRYNGGCNAGHTVKVGNKIYKLHHIPSGIVSGKICIMGNGVIFDPVVMLGELHDLEEKGINTTKLFLSKNAHTILPYHNIFDGIMGGKIGTTGRGTGPCYADKMYRTGIRAEDLLLPEDQLRGKIETELEDKNFLLEHKYHLDTFDPQELAEKYAELGKRLQDRIMDTSGLLKKFMRDGRNVLFEGAQGTLLDIDHGTYPFVTSSNSTAGGACTGSGIGPKDIDDVIGVGKAYTTRVGEGPFPTELGDPNSKEFQEEKLGDKFTDEEIREMLASGDEYLLGKAIRLRGVEFGTTTTRPRRVGWPDFNIFKYARDINSIQRWAVTKLDVLNGIELKIAKNYEGDGDLLVPVYDDMTYGWGEINQEEMERIVRDGFDAMPEGMKGYLIHWAEFTETPIAIASLSPDRKHTVTRNVLERTSQYL